MYMEVAKYAYIWEILPEKLKTVMENRSHSLYNGNNNYTKKEKED